MSVNNSTETICYKITQCFQLIEEAVKTGTFDMRLSKLLHQIRQDANRMEAGLKGRKAAMIEAGIEEKYQGKPVAKPTGINLISELGDQIVKNPEKFEVTIKQGDKVLYHNTTRSVVLYAAEQITELNERGELFGNGQSLYVGHPVTLLFAFDQIIQAFESQRANLLAASQEFTKAMFNNLSPEAKKHFLESITK